MNTKNQGWTLFYKANEMNLSYFNYTKKLCIAGVVEGYGASWAKLKKDGFSVRKIKAREVK